MCSVSKPARRSPTRSPAFPALLAHLALAGALVTIDARGRRTKVAEAIRDKGADYLLALKDNGPVLRAEVERCFADSKADTCTHHDTFNGGHGRVAIRRHAEGHEIDWLKSNRHFSGEWRFKGLAMMARVKAEVGRDGKTSTERRDFLSSARLSARRFATAVRAHWHIENAHWHIENRLHWVMDVVFHDALMRLRTDNGPANRAAVKQMSLNLIRNINDKASIKVRRKTLAWDDQ